MAREVKRSPYRDTKDHEFHTISTQAGTKITQGHEFMHRLEDGGDHTRATKKELGTKAMLGPDCDHDND